ncbi:MAG: UPF0179 family protein [Candidatus Helarchaeota archaeon]
MKEILTLIGKKQAKIGYKFRFIGQCSNYNNCKEFLRNICINNLEKNQVYEIIEVRKVYHDCIVHLDGVCTVKVKNTPIIIAINSKFAHEGAILKYIPIKCNNEGCKFHEFCVPIEFEKDIEYRCRILKIKDRKKNICSIFPDFSLIEVEKI